MKERKTEERTLTKKRKGERKRGIEKKRGIEGRERKNVRIQNSRRQTHTHAQTNSETVEWKKRKTQEIYMCHTQKMSSGDSRLQRTGNKEKNE